MDIKHYRYSRRAREISAELIISVLGANKETKNIYFCILISCFYPSVALSLPALIHARQ